MEKYIYRLIRVPENNEGTFRNAIREAGGDIIQDPTELSEENIDSLLRIIRRNSSPDGVVMAISKNKLTARKRQFEAMLAGDIAKTERAIRDYYASERQWLIYQDIVSGRIQFPSSSLHTENELQNQV